MASHPTNDSMSTVPAVPIADQPCGANGVQLSMRADGSAPTTATTITAVRRPTNPSWTAPEACPPPVVSATTASNSTAARATVTRRPPPTSCATYARADQADDRSAEHGPDEEARGDGTFGARTERRPGETGRPGPARVAAAERAEHHREQAGDAQQTQPGHDRRRTGDLGGQAGHQQHAGSEEGADVEGDGSGRGQLAHTCKRAENGDERDAECAALEGPSAQRSTTIDRLCFSACRTAGFDKTDRAILTILQREGRMPNVELAERVALSPSSCLRRTKALEAAGLIAGYRAELDRQRLGLGLTVFISLRVQQHSRVTSRVIEDALTAIPAVVACYVVSGEADFLVEAVVPDLGAYESLLLDKVLAIDAVSDARSTFAIRTVLGRGALPVDSVR